MSRASRFVIVPRDIQTGADSFKRVYDIDLQSANRQTLMYGNQGYTRLRDAHRAVDLIRKVASEAIITLGRPRIDRSLLPKED
jgi:uncharacterized protein YegP (UPF0339 family)